MFWNESTTCSGGDCLVSWETACRLRSEGGLGLIDLGVQNTCLLLKNVYKLLTGVDNPWTTWICRWYFGGGAPPPTPLWRTYKNLVPLLRSITTVTVGDGVSTSFWFDNWTSLGPLAHALPDAFLFSLSSDASMAAEASRPVALARRDRVSAIASAEFSLVERALGEFTLSTVPDARAMISISANGFRAADAYCLLHSMGCGPPLHDLKWDNFAPVKVRVFIWILRHRLTHTRLHRLGVLGSPDCPFCSGVTEDVYHLFVACPRLLSVWRRASMTPQALVPASLKDMIDAFCGAHQN
jgi:hypothetical protein